MKAPRRKREYPTPYQRPSESSSGKPLPSNNESPTEISAAESLPSAKDESPKEYIMNFGKHKGRPISNVPRSYLQWITDECDMFQRDKALRDAILAQGIKRGRASSPPAPLSKDWKAPDLREAPRRFWTSFDDDFTWISQRDASYYFGISGFHKLPKVSPANTGPTRYYLWHVWSLTKTRGGEKLADERMRAFLDKNEDRESEILGSLGLGSIGARAGGCYEPELTADDLEVSRRWDDGSVPGFEEETWMLYETDDW